MTSALLKILWWTTPRLQLDCPTRILNSWSGQNKTKKQYCEHKLINLLFHTLRLQNYYKSVNRATTLHEKLVHETRSSLYLC